MTKVVDFYPDGDGRNQLHRLLSLSEAKNGKFFVA